MDKEPSASGYKSVTKNTTSTAKDCLKQRLMKGDNPPTLGSKMDTTDHVGLGAESGLTPSLLDEVLAEKKLALMRSPEVVQFLQTQQERVGYEKRQTNKPPSTCMNTPKELDS